MMNEDCTKGNHEYSEKLTFDKHGLPVNRCKHCKLHGYYELFNGTTMMIEYYPNGYPKREVWDNGDEFLFDTNGKPVD